MSEIKLSKRQQRIQAAKARPAEVTAAIRARERAKPEPSAFVKLRRMLDKRTKRELAEKAKA